MSFLFVITCLTFYFFFLDFFFFKQETAYECKYGLVGSEMCIRDRPGFTGWGSFAELVAVSAADANVVGLPESVGFVEAAALGCRLATAYRAVVSVGRVARGEWLVVHGCGGVGLSAVLVGVALGARVVGVDVSEAARAAALGLGAAAAVAPGADLLAITEGGAHVSVDAIGSVDVLAASVRSLRPRGRHVQVGLLLGSAAEAAVRDVATVAGATAVARAGAPAPRARRTAGRPAARAAARGGSSGCPGRALSLIHISEPTRPY